MEAYYYIGAIMLCRVIQAVFSKRSSNEINNIPLLIKYSAVAKGISAIFALLLIAVDFKGINVTPLGVLIAVGSGITLFLGTFCSVYGMKTGTVSAVSMFGTAGLLIPLLAGVFLFSQPINIYQWLGVVVFFISAFLLVKSSKETYSGFNIKTVLLLIGTLISNGGTMLMQQMYTNYVPNGDISIFSFISFASVSILGTPLYFIFLKTDNKEHDKNDYKFSKPLIVCAVSLAFALFIINQFATACTAFVPAVILFTVINGGGTVISTVVAAVMYKEKLTPKIVIGVILGIVSLVAIKAFA